MLAKLKVSGFPDLCFLVKCPEVVGEGEVGRQGGRETEAGRQGGKEGGRAREAGKQGGREAGREAGRQAGRQGEEMRNEGMSANIFFQGNVQQKLGSVSQSNGNGEKS